MKDRYFSSKIVEWYMDHHRQLPWRNTRDAYKIWLSEIILQQTRVLQGLPYYRKFIQHYPNVRALAAAKEQEVLRLWQGLGYYSRARNLHKCAKTVVTKFGAKFPRSGNALKSLEGVGDYTAAAVASLAFDEPVAVVDGNVFRVLARLFGVHKSISSTEGKRFFADLANQLIPAENPGAHNQAVMEFGALHCLPRNPKCESCIFKNECLAYRNGQQNMLPIKVKPRRAKHRYFYYLVVRQRGSVLMSKRTARDIWRGLYDFPLHEEGRRIAADRIPALLFASLNVNWRQNQKCEVSREYKHVLTHQIIHARFIEIERLEKNSWRSINHVADARFYPVPKISRLPKPVLISRYLLDRRIL